MQRETSGADRERYDALAQAMVAGSGVVAGKMFGMPVLKLGGKAFAGYQGGCMVFKLRGPAHARALGLPGAALFDPMGGRPMKEWVQVPASSVASTGRTVLPPAHATSLHRATLRSPLMAS